MEKKDFSKLKAFFKGNGFYLVLMLCVMAIGITAWTTLKPKLSRQFDDTAQIEYQPNMTSSQPQYQTVQNPQSNVPVSQEKPNKDNEKEKDADSEKEDIQTASDNKKEKETDSDTEYKFPCGNTILNEYSDGELVFSQTMQDWRTHNGVDFTASKGTPVTAICEGTVEDIYEDMMLGWVVKVKHSGGYTALYCGLQKNLAVKKGQEVKSDTVIGGVGDIPCEITEAEHFHFELYKGDEQVNPMKILGKTIEKPALGNGRADR